MFSTNFAVGTTRIWISHILKEAFISIFAHLQLELLTVGTEIAESNHNDCSSSETNLIVQKESKKWKTQECTMSRQFHTRPPAKSSWKLNFFVSRKSCDFMKAFSFLTTLSHELALTSSCQRFPVYSKVLRGSRLTVVPTWMGQWYTWRKQYHLAPKQPQSAHHGYPRNEPLLRSDAHRVILHSALQQVDYVSCIEGHIYWTAMCNGSDVRCRAAYFANIGS